MSAEQTFRNLRLGTDLVHVPRLEAALQRFGDAFAERLLTPGELSYCRSGGKTEQHFLRRMAGRVAVKEAVSKALGIGINGLGWQDGAGWRDIELVSQPQKAPELVLSGKARLEADASGIRDWRVSLSHDGDYAMATVIGLI